MGHGKNPKGQTMIYKALHRRLEIEQSNKASTLTIILGLVNQTQYVHIYSGLGRWT
jgi:hypothetical protein